MGYGRRDRLRIELGVCLDCGERAAKRYRRCLKCRRATPSQRMRDLLKARRVSYVFLKEKGWPQ